ncbi:MAG: DUF1552 domain-containing protein [Sandaracinaceae bacterium]
MTSKLRSLGRRRFLWTLGGAAAAVPFAGLASRVLGDGSATARRVLFYYFPDGVPGVSQDGEGSLWNPWEEGGAVRLSEALEPLGDLARECVFVRGLQMGSADEGSHPGGAKKLLTGMDGGRGESLDRTLARTAGASDPHPHLYLGVMANQDGASGDKHISYLGPEHTVPPEDDPIRAFGRLFRDATPSAPTPSAAWDPRRSILDVSRQEVEALRGSIGGRQRSKLELHLDAIREVEARLTTDLPPAPSTCDDPRVATDGVDPDRLYDPSTFPALLRAQTDVMVTAMACGLTRVGVLQCSHHTSELIMSRLPGSEMYDAGFDMRSHQASHYGASHDRGNRLFTDYLKQRRYWVQGFRYLLEQLAARPEGDGTMLDHSLVVLCSEVSDGNTHSHHDMPFVVAGRAGGALSTGRVLDAWDRPHGELLLSIAHAMGQRFDSYGQAGSQPLPGLLG